MNAPVVKIALDLHCHSIASDGALAPAELVARVAARGGKVLALTDHDDLSGLPEAHQAAQVLGVELIDGVEISVSYGSKTLHVVGLGLDTQDAQLNAGLAQLRVGRFERAQRMADSLAKVGIQGALEGAKQYALNPDLIGRVHFGRFLIEQGHAKDMKAVFKRFLVKGKLGYASHQWATLQDAVRWIIGAGGIAVLAHPGRYDIGSKSMDILLTLFKEMGGQGIEVVTSSHTLDMTQRYARMAQKHQLWASLGSDFHSPNEGRAEPGVLPLPPQGCEPIWHHLPLKTPLDDLWVKGN